MFSSHIEGTTGDIAIANKFADYYKALSGPPPGAVKLTDLAFVVDEMSASQYECSEGLLSVEEVDKLISLNLKLGKAPGVDNIVAEHIVYSHPAVVFHLTNLFNMMICHGYVPSQFGISVVVPIVKNKNGDISKLANYRPISLSPVVAKLFEACLRSKFDMYLQSSDLQFGFKKHSGCHNAIFVVQQLVQYYNRRGSSVYIAALDASKAFDRVDHSTLVNKLQSRNVPLCFIRIVINWYCKLKSVVRWNGVFSIQYEVFCGVRQGGVLSPILFNLYVDDLLNGIENRQIGCRFLGMNLGCIMYADDILLLSASVDGLQHLLDACSDYAQKHHLVFNCDKSVCMKVGGSYKYNISNMILNNNPVNWVDSVRYLGITFRGCGSLRVDCADIKRRFYVACNSVLGRCKYADECVKLSLVKSMCLPMLTYCLGALDMSGHIVKDLGVCWNDCFRRIFNYNRWESVRDLQYCCGLEPMEDMYSSYREKYLHSVCLSPVVQRVKAYCTTGSL